ncbi:MAG TPA: hypothetical protein PK239_13130 [Chitinophagales bacterium]|nr:hypothetical protein [Chitinophagales bacterium]HRK28214.1 hypothetical protein [Chitinophagales bacterium]
MQPETKKSDYDPYQLLGLINPNAKEKRREKGKSSGKKKRVNKPDP